MHDRVFTAIVGILPRRQSARPAARRPVAKLAARRIGAMVAVLDGLCARMNEGLAAFALVLALLLAVTIVAQHTADFLLPDAASGLATGDMP